MGWNHQLYSVVQYVYIHYNYIYRYRYRYLGMWKTAGCLLLGKIPKYDIFASISRFEMNWNTLLGTNTFCWTKMKMMFLFPRWDMLISWRVVSIIHSIFCGSLMRARDSTIFTMVQEIFLVQVVASDMSKRFLRLKKIALCYHNYRFYINGCFQK